MSTRNIVFKRANGSIISYSTVDIERLFTTTSAKSRNGYVSTERENMLKAILTHRTHFENRSPFITDMVANLRETMKEFSGYKIRHMGGRTSDYDFKLHKPNQQWFKLEYKFSCHENHDSIFRQPQLTSLSTESKSCRLFMKSDLTYLEFVYGSVFSELCASHGIDIPPCADYIRVTKSTVSKKTIESDWFAKLVEISKENKTHFGTLFKRSISEYIHTVHFDLDAMCEWFKERHRNKLILCQNKGEFRMEKCDDIFRVDTLRFCSVEPLATNKVVVRTNADFDVQLYIRWKNTTGLQNPALDFKPILRHKLV